MRYQLLHAFRLEERRISHNQCAHTSASGKFSFFLHCPLYFVLTHRRFIRNSCAQKLGFSNAELLQDTDWDKVKLDPRRAAPKLPKWVWSHDPEAYAYENYEKAAQSMKKGIKMEDENSFEPNYPKGYKYEPWSIEKVMEDMRAGKPIDLGPGDWE
jgi:hypothetical protein